MPTLDLFNGPGRRWLAAQPLPSDEVAAVERHVRELDQLGEDLKRLDREIAIEALDDPTVARLMTITGVNLTVATGLIAAIGDVHRFATPQKLVSYFGLNPRVRQSGFGAAHRGRISKAGRSHARANAGGVGLSRGEDAGTAARLLRAYSGQARSPDRRRGAARKLTALCWHLLSKDTDYLWTRPALVSAKRRTMELQAGKPQKKGNKRGPAYAYNVKALRDQDMKVAELAEKSYEHLVGQWRARPPRGEGAQTPQTGRT